MLSGLKEQPFNAAVRHPAFAAPNLSSNLGLPHNAEEFNPVFFGSPVDVSGPRYDDSTSHSAMIQAQIEALEQEKIFVAQAAQQDYHRTSMAMQIEALEQEQSRLVREQDALLYMSQPQQQQQSVEEPRTILDLQRQMEAHARQRASTVWYDPISAQSYIADEPIVISLATDASAAGSDSLAGASGASEQIALRESGPSDQVWGNRTSGVQLRY